MSHVNHIRFAIAYEGSSQFFGRDAHVETIDLVGTKSEISAQLIGPGDSSLEARHLKWYMNKDINNLGDQVALTPEVAKAFQITARVFEYYKDPAVDDATRHKKVKENWLVEVILKKQDRPKFETGKCYLIKIQNVDGFSLKATFAKVDEPTSNDKEMGKDLLTQGINNLQLPSKGGGWHAHLSKDAILLAQEAVPKISVQDTKLSDGDTDLDCLTPEELQTRFAETYKKGKELERQRPQAMPSVSEFNKIVIAERRNNQLLFELTVACEKKGFIPLIPSPAINLQKDQ